MGHVRGPSASQDIMHAEATRQWRLLHARSPRRNPPYFATIGRDVGKHLTVHRFYMRVTSTSLSEAVAAADRCPQVVAVTDCMFVASDVIVELCTATTKYNQLTSRL